MKQPPAIPPAPQPGPAYDPMDRIVQDLQNIESFLSRLAMNPKDLDYLNQHLSAILALRRTIAAQLKKLADEPYNYSPIRLQTLQQDNEKLFMYLEEVVGMMNPWNEKKFKKAMQAAEEALSRFDGNLTP